MHSDAIGFAAPIPVLRIYDVGLAYEFYPDFLGFAVDWEHRFGARWISSLSRDPGPVASGSPSPTAICQTRRSSSAIRPLRQHSAIRATGLNRNSVARRRLAAHPCRRLP
ncbi:glyoxalase superfamily protein [Nocardia nova]|uniref:glyoxalase superfamily protein n=1 Tax=Nocardia nova TaxID=37330 RepID=UPI001CA5AE82|nr:glyoxalase superfamily protein [Nocardia nova]